MLLQKIKTANTLRQSIHFYFHFFKSLQYAFHKWWGGTFPQSQCPVKHNWMYSTENTIYVEIWKAVFSWIPWNHTQWNFNKQNINVQTRLWKMIKTSTEMKKKKNSFLFELCSNFMLKHFSALTKIWIRPLASNTDLLLVEPDVFRTVEIDPKIKNTKNTRKNL